MYISFPKYIEGDEQRDKLKDILTDILIGLLIDILMVYWYVSAIQAWYVTKLWITGKVVKDATIILPKIVDEKTIEKIGKFL